MEAIQIYEFEKAALNPYFKIYLNEDDCSNQDDDSLVPLLQYVADGNYVEALKYKRVVDAISFIKSPRPIDVSILDHFKDLFKTYLESAGTSGEIIVHCIGICCLQIFTQNNFSGPLLGPSPSSVIPGLIPSGKDADAVRLEAMKELVLDTEGVYSLLSGPEYLILARIIFFELRGYLSSCQTGDWWCFRYGLIHQKIADEQSPSLYETLIDCINKIESNSELLNEHRHISSLFHLEVGHLYLQYYDVAKASKHIGKAFIILGLEVNLTGALGRRTKWQQHDLAQLVVKVSYKDKNLREDELPGPNLLPSDLPKDVLLTDDTRLHRINYKEVDEDVIPDLRPIEQMALLAHLILKRRSQAADIQLNEETKAFLFALLQYPKNWSVQASSLVMRSRIESGEFRTMERSMNQLEELMSAVNREEPSRHERLKLIHSSLLMPHWAVQQDLARIFMKMGCTKTALELFERLHLWDDVIICYNELQLRQRSAEVITKLMEKEETPKLWCLLGDATDDIECYNKAWELSGQKSGKAQRCLGNYYYVRREHTKAIEHYEISVTINGLQFPIWQRMAYCALQIEDWEKCAKSYGRCSVLEPDNYECWNNMSQAYIKLGQTHRAWKSLQEALRCRMDNWRLWDNYMIVSASLGYMTQALNAYKGILQYKERHVDTEILGRIVNAIVENKKDPEGHEMRLLHKKCTDLLGKLTREVATHPELWFLYAELIYCHPDLNESSRHTAMQHYRKSIAAATQKPGWDKNSDIATLVLMRILRLLSVANEVSKDSNAKAALSDLSSIRMLIRGTVESIKRSQTSIETGELVQQVQVPLKQVEREMINVNNFIDKLRISVTL